VRVRSLVVARCCTATVFVALLAGPGAGGFPTTETALGAAPESYAAVADAFVSARSPERNFGSLPTLRIGGAARARSYVRFTLPQPPRAGGPAIRLHLYATSGSRAGVAVRLVRRGGGWRERSIAAASAPPLGRVVGRHGASGRGWGL